MKQRAVLVQPHCPHEDIRRQAEKNSLSTVGGSGRDGAMRFGPEPVERVGQQKPRKACGTVGWFQLCLMCLCLRCDGPLSEAWESGGCVSRLLFVNSHNATGHKSEQNSRQLLSAELRQACVANGPPLFRLLPLCCAIIEWRIQRFGIFCDTLCYLIWRPVDRQKVISAFKQSNPFPSDVNHSLVRAPWLLPFVILWYFRLRSNIFGYKVVKQDI